MQWLIINMWMLLATVAVFAIFLGWSLRGLFSSGQVRRAVIEREIVQTELDQIRTEVEALYQSRRTKASAFADPSDTSGSLQAKIDERDSRIQTLEAEIANLQSETDATHPSLTAADAAAAGALAGTVLTNEDSNSRAALKNLEDRNQWLETRIAELQNDLEAGVAAAAASSADNLQEKLIWQTGYLRQRVSALETSVLDQRQSAQDTELPQNSTSDEDMARLRWRNRYLEGRLAYYEEQNSDVPDVEPADAPKVTSLLDSSNAVGELAASTQTEIAPVGDKGTHPSDAMLAELNDETPLDASSELNKPAAQNKPSNGGDDLTRIDGIGPKIAEVLNGLGIWTHAQIAEWSPANAAWIDNHLAFQGRVERENWVGQAVNVMAAPNKS